MGSMQSAPRNEYSSDIYAVSKVFTTGIVLLYAKKNEKHWKIWESFCAKDVVRLVGQKHGLLGLRGPLLDFHGKIDF